MLKIEILVVGELQENCYIVTKNGKTLIVDPGDEAKRIIVACKDKNVVEILVTHYHFDHIGALEDVKKEFGLEENVRSGYFNYEVINTPGHKEDAKTFYFPEDNIMFCGDFIFKGTIGRCDLEGGNVSDMINSLKCISKYPDDTVIYPGHGDSTTLGVEKKFFNYYF